ncbi:MAG: CehA/McbA family metallohydrolase [Armatimonadota bacterium]|jgi:hypothetical protein
MLSRPTHSYAATLIVALLTPLPHPAWAAPATLTGKVISSDGASLRARVVIATEDWKKSQVAFTDEKGMYRLSFQSGKCVVAASHGFEYSIAEHAIELAPGRNTLDFRLDRLLDMSRLGWHCGDVHMHSKRGGGAQQPAALARAARCEGLDWAVLTDTNTTAGLNDWRAQASPDFVPLAGQEIATPRGQILALGITDAIDSDTSNGANDMYRIWIQIGAQGGLTAIARPNAPGAAYRDWDLKAYDAIQTLNGALPAYGGGFDMLQGLRRWYDLLNAGERPVAVGGSDNRDITGAPLRRLLENPSDAAKKDADIRLALRALDAEALRPFVRGGGYLGAVRTYVHCSEPDPDAILTALRGGPTFVTTGPLLLATVDGTLPGETVDSRGTNAVPITLEAVSNRALERIDIVADGEVVRSIPGAQLRRIERTLELPLAGRRWLVVECRGTWPDIAVTNAWRLQP